jgi:hypothetical protein
VKAQKKRIIVVLPANLDPLIDPVDLDIHALVDAVGRMYSNRPRSHMLPVNPQGEKRPDRDKEERDDGQDEELRDP